MGARVFDDAGEAEIIVLKDQAALEGMRQAGQLVAETLALLRGLVAPGVTTALLDERAQEYIVARGGIPSFLGYPGPTPFPGAICTSVNDTVVHGIPGARALVEGDIISLDVGAILDGWHGDAAITVPVGAVTDEVQRLIADTEGALAAAIAVAKPGNRLVDVSAAVARYGQRRGYGIVREFTGHGIGREMHEAPSVPNVIVRGGGSGPTPSCRDDLHDRADLHARQRRLARTGGWLDDRHRRWSPGSPRGAHDRRRCARRDDLDASGLSYGILTDCGGHACWQAVTCFSSGPVRAE